MTAPAEVLLVTVTGPAAGARTRTWVCPPDLRFTTTAPGGFDTLSCTLTWPTVTTAPVDVLTPEAVVQVVDRNTGDIVWYGTLDDPGRTADPAALSYRVTATGPRKILDQVTHAYARCDRDLTSWVSLNEWPQSTPSIGDGTGFVANSFDWPSDPPDGYWEFTMPDGGKLVTDNVQSIRYRPAMVSAERTSTGTDLVWIFYSFVASAAGGGTHAVELRVNNLAGSAATASSNQWTTTQNDRSISEDNVAWTVADTKHVSLRWHYTGGGGTRTSDAWVRIANIAVYFRGYARDGTTLSAGSSVTSVHAGGLMHDMIGRFLTGRVDSSATVMFPTTPAVDQAAWWGGVTAREVADFVQGIQPDYWWAVWEPGASGLPRFEYRPWEISGGVASNLNRYHLTGDDTTARFQGGLDEVFNEAIVAYQRADGVPASVLVQGSVDVLTRLGQTRRTVIDLTGRGPLSPSVASSLGLSELSKLNAAASAGSATVRAPVMDRVTGRTVYPWELLPGWYCRVVDEPTQTAQQAFGVRDGLCQFRVTSVTFDAATGTAELALDGGSRSVFSRRRSPAVPKSRMNGRAEYATQGVASKK